MAGNTAAAIPVSTDSLQGRLRVDLPPEAAAAGRVLLALRAQPVTPGGRLQVRAGGDDPIQAEILGQFTPTADADERVVDITRHVRAHPAHAPLVLQVVAEGSAASGPGEAPAPATVLFAELRIHQAR